MLRKAPLAVSAALTASLFAAALAPPISSDRQVLQVLSRLTFGPRPDDVDRVKKLGVRNFIAEQLHPESIPENPVLQAKLAPLDTLRMTSVEMAEKYPPPQLVKAMVEGRVPYPSDPETRMMIAKLVARYKAKENADAKPESDEQDSTRLEDASLTLSADQRQLLQEGTPEQKVTLIVSMPDDEQYKLLDALGGKRRQLYASASPDLRRKIEKLGGPVFVVSQDLSDNKILRAVYSNRQLEEVLTDFWYNHFNVFLNKGADRYLVTSYERDVIRPHVLGKFRDLLLATAQSPAMLFYLDNAQSVRNDMPAPPNAKNKHRGLNENYGRELMELHTLGVDGGYTQHDVTEVARCFTGWTVRRARLGGTFQFNERAHDQGEKVVLGHKISANGGMNDGLMVIDILAHQPATAKFISKSLAIRFVSDNPPQALVDRMAQTFTSKDGDLRAVLKTMFDSPEFFCQEAYRAKLKSPFEMVVSALRATNSDVDFGFAIAQQLNQLGQPLYKKVEPTGYSNQSGDWVNSASLLARMNFAIALTSNKVPGVKVDLSSLAPGDPMNTGLSLGSPDFQRR